LVFLFRFFRKRLSELGVDEVKEVVFVEEQVVFGPPKEVRDYSLNLS